MPSAVAKNSKPGSRKKSEMLGSKTLEKHKDQLLFADVKNGEQVQYYFQVDVTGLRRRMFGPFETEAEAIEHFDGLLQDVLEAFCDVANESGACEHIVPPSDLKPLSLGAIQ